MGLLQCVTLNIDMELGQGARVRGGLPEAVVKKIPQLLWQGYVLTHFAGLFQ